MAFFGFLRISNLAPHASREFDKTRHLTPNDVRFYKNYMEIDIKWSKTLQFRDKIHTLTLPRLKGSPLCPVKALQKALAVYTPSYNDPLFQIFSGGWKVVTDSRIRKVLAKLNQKMGLEKNHYTFHAFRCSGATLAFRAHVPIQKIKHHGSWTSDCVWTYIQQDQSFSRDIAKSFANVVMKK